MSVNGVVKVTNTNPDSNAEGFAVRQVGIPSAAAAAEGLANPTTVQQLAHGLRWNSATWDREMGNIDGTAMTNATRTGATADGSDIVNYNHRGAHFVLNYSTGGTSNLIMMKVQGKDSLTGIYYNIATTVTLSATGSAAYIIYPGITSGAGVAMVSSGAASALLPRTWRVSVVQSGTSLTANFGVGYSMIV